MTSGALWRVSGLYWLGSALVLCSLVPATLAGPRFPSAFESIVPLGLLVAAAAGLVLLFVAVRRTVRLAGEISRSLHAAAPLCLLAGGVVALPTYFLILLLGSTGHAGPNAVWWSVALPVVLGLVGLGLLARDRRTASPALDASAPRGTRSGVIVASVVVLAIVMLVLPLLVVAMLGPTYWMLSVSGFSNANARIAQANVTRRYGVPKDPSITALAAGQAFNTLMRSTGNDRPSRFVLRPQSAVPYGLPPWGGPIPGNLFASARWDLAEGIPATGAILQAASRGFRPDEMAYLAGFAHAGQWRDFAMVARAPSFDYIGARYELPFADTAGGWWEFPMPGFNAVKTLAYAGVSRAAYYLARGQRDSAETALREIVSFGFTLVGQGNTLIEHLIGTVVVGIGRQALIDYYHVIGDPRGARLAAARDSAMAAGQSSAAPTGRGGRRDAVAVRAEARRVASDPTQLRGARLQMLNLLSAAPCTNLRELVFGPDADIRASFAAARATWARFASDTALLDLVYRTTDRIQPIALDGVGSSALMAASVFSGGLLRNRRVSTCARQGSQLGLFFGRLGR